MYAIVDIAGQQFKVKKDQKIFVHRLIGEVGNQVDFDRVLLIDNDSNVSVGAPVLEGAMVSAKILEHLKGDKVIIFKKRRRKGYRVKNGHRQYLTQIVIEEIIEKGAKPKIAEKKASEPKAVAKPIESEVAEASKPKAAAKKPAEPKVAAKPEAEKKAAPAKKPAAEKATAAKKPAEPKTAAKPAAAKKVPAAKKPAPEKATAAKKPATKKPAAPKKAVGKKK
jgi:large subunit ribosomal protein L21